MFFDCDRKIVVSCVLCATIFEALIAKLVVKINIIVDNYWRSMLFVDVCSILVANCKIQVTRFALLFFVDNISFRRQDKYDFDKKT